MTNTSGGESKELGGAASITESIRGRLAEEERTIRWLARRTEIPYSTLQKKLSLYPGRLTTDELFLIADALRTDVRNLYGQAA